MSHPVPERVKKSVRLDIRAIAIISDYAAKHGCNETDALNRLILATQEPPMSHPLPSTATHELLVDRVLALETQMLVVIDRLNYYPIALPDPSKDFGLRPMEPVAIDSKISPESSFISDKAGISTSEFTQYVEPLLRAYSSGGYYFRFDWLEQSELKPTLQELAKLLGFINQPIRVDGKSIRVYLNRHYCLQSMYT